MQDSEEMELDGMAFMLRSIPPPLRANAFKLIPSSYWTTCTCCVMYDGHPRDDKKIDIIICLQGGKVLELYQKEPVSYIQVPDVLEFKEIRILRNYKGALFYLAAAANNVIIFSRKNKLEVHWSFSNVSCYEICDPECSGEAQLMVKTASSTFYISLANELEITNVPVNRRLEQTEPVLGDLKQKCIELKHNLQSNEKAYKQIERFRQNASFLCTDEKLKTPKPIIIFCNKKIVIVLGIENPYPESMENVCVLIHNNSCMSISYTSKVYEGLRSSPFYREIEQRDIKSKSKMLVTAIIPIKEFKDSVSSKIEFSVILTYERQGKDYLKPFDNIIISAADVMGKKFDIFSSPDIDDRSVVLAMLATTTKTTLCFKKKGLEGNMMDPAKILCKHLNMDLLDILRDVAIHKHSPHHILHGMMIIFDEDKNYIHIAQDEFNFSLDVYSRSPEQVRALIHFVYDNVPLKLIVTTPNIRLSSHTCSNNGANKNLLNFETAPCAESLLNQCSMTLKYLCDCKKEMKKKWGKKRKSLEQIDLLALGQEEFVKYRNNMLAEAEYTFEQIIKCSLTSETEDSMEIDDT